MSLHYTTVGNPNGLKFKLEWDASVAQAPAAFVRSVEFAAADLASNFSTNETITVRVGYGDLLGVPFADPQALAESWAWHAYEPVPYSELRSALQAESGLSTVQAEAATNLPAQDPLPAGSTVGVYAPEAAALGIGPNRGLDGAIGFSPDYSYFFSENAPTPDGLDAVGVEEHELSEMMGRISLLGDVRDRFSNPDGKYSLLDFYRYSAPGKHDFRNTHAYFSLDGGATNLGTYPAAPYLADPADWSLTTQDSFGPRIGGVPSPLSGVDVAEMAALGYRLSPTGLAAVQNLQSVDPSIGA